MEILLEKAGIIDFKYKKLRSKDSFNIFEILINRTDEVNLHSKFICELLDCTGSHNMGNAFAEHFIQIIDIPDFSLENYEVFKEYKNIDILLANKTQAIIIENKIWAYDQNQQLERYYKEIIKEGFSDVYVIYLTLDGKEPGLNSVGKLMDKAKIFLVSYNYHVSKWIDECIKLSARIPQLRETLVQYQRLINDLTGNTMEQEQLNELIELISKNDNVLKAQKIVESWVHVEWHTEFDFWNDLAQKISSKYKILETQKYSAEKLDNIWHKTRNRNPLYGIMFKIADYKGYNVNLYVERGWYAMYYGITMEKSGNRDASDLKIFDEFAEKIESFCDWGREHLWIGGNSTEPEVNFELFNDEETLKLCNQDYRRKFIDTLWLQIEDFIKKCKKELC